MGGGDLNMKKSWHPLLRTNMERVWKEEKKALDERKRVSELQKELAQERAVQELQRLQQESGGARREERVEWMYAAPAEGNGPNAEELEAYLLGKKRVDKLLQGNEEKMMAAPTASAPGGSFQSLQNANSARDTAAKIREDPLLAIKRQEQAQYEKILKNPKRLKELRAAREAATPAPKKSKKDETKEERRIRKEKKRATEGGLSEGREHKRSRDDDDGYRSSKRYDDRDRDRSPRRSSSHNHTESSSSRRYDDRDRHHYDYDRERRPRSRSRSPRRSRSPPPPPREDSRAGPSNDNGNGYSNGNGNGYSNGHGNGNGYRQPSRPYERRPPPPAPSGPTPAEEEARAARLAAMQSSASQLSAERNARLARLEAEDRAQFEKDEEAKSGGGKLAPKFLREQEKKVFGGGMDLGERMKRSGRVGMVGDRE